MLPFPVVTKIRQAIEKHNSLIHANFTQQIAIESRKEEMSSNLHNFRN